MMHEALLTLSRWESFKHHLFAWAGLGGHFVLLFLAWEVLTSSPVALVAFFLLVGVNALLLEVGLHQLGKIKWEEDGKARRLLPPSVQEGVHEVAQSEGVAAFTLRVDRDRTKNLAVLQVGEEPTFTLGRDFQREPPWWEAHHRPLLLHEVAHLKQSRILYSKFGNHVFRMSRGAVLMASLALLFQGSLLEGLALYLGGVLNTILVAQGKQALEVQADLWAASRVGPRALREALEAYMTWASPKSLPGKNLLRPLLASHPLPRERYKACRKWEALVGNDFPPSRMNEAKETACSIPQAAILLKFAISPKDYHEHTSRGYPSPS